MHRALYRLLVALVGLLVRSGGSKDLEIVVLRHQLTVLRRQVDRTTLTEPDRALLGAVAAALARPRRAGCLVTPDTLLRWHRQRIARHWTRPHQPAGRPPIAAGVRRLTVRMARENPTWGYRRNAAFGIPRIMPSGRLCRAGSVNGSSGAVGRVGVGACSA